MDNSGEKLGSLEQESIKRKERLMQLKRKVEDGNEASQKPKFRSYTPQDKALSENENNTDKVLDNTIDEEIKEQLDLIKTPIVFDEIDIANLAPRKQDWDLKRDIAKKLEKLELQTAKAIGELIRERLKNTQEQENILQAVNLGTEFKIKD